MQLQSDFHSRAHDDNSPPQDADLDHGGPAEPKKPSHTRINLACLKCRSRRARCSGTRPTCESCAKTDSVCVWPEGRRRKRTRAEMQAAERQNRLEAQTGGGAPESISAPALKSTKGDQQHLPLGALPSAAQSLHDQQFAFPTPLPVPSSVQFPAASMSAPNDYTAFDFTTFNPLANDMFAWAPQSHFDLSSTPNLSQQVNSSSSDQGNPIVPGTSQSQNLKEPSPIDPQNGSAMTNDQRVEQAPQQFNQEELLRALGSQKVFIEGDPANSETIDLFYYRIAGSTAIHPGINRINLRLHKASTNTSPYSQAPVTPVEESIKSLGDASSCQKTSSVGSNTSPAHTASPSIPRELLNPMFDDTGMPLPSVYEPLLELFFSRASAFFPSISQKRMAQRLETGTMSAFMLNCICAISARFAPKAASNPISASAPFFSRAQELLIPLLHLPAHDVVTGLLLLAWAAYGQNSEAACWQFAGIAFRMAIDMGLHENQEIYESKGHLIRTRLLFWSLFVTDRVLCFAYGRPASISEEIIEIPLPGDADMFPDPSRNNSPAAAEEPVEPVPFIMLVRLMVQVGRISNVLNGRRGRKRTLVNANEPPPRLLAELQNQLVKLYTNMPASLRWSVDNFKHHDKRGHGGLFLTLHLWANAVLTLTYHPELMTNPAGAETPIRSSLQRSVNLSLASARLTTECLVYADLCSSNAYTCAPLVVQPIYVAALAFLHEVKLDNIQSSGERSQDGQDQNDLSGGNQVQKDGNTEAFLASLHKQSLTTLSRALQRIETYWAGCAYVTNILAQRQSGLNYFRIDPTLKAKRAAISLPDHGLLRRFQTSNPTVKSATETSLRESMAAEQFTEFPLEDLFPNFEVQQTFITPATSFDVAQLLNNYESSL